MENQKETRESFIEEGKKIILLHKNTSVKYAIAHVHSSEHRKTNV